MSYDKTGNKSEHDVCGPLEQAVQLAAAAVAAAAGNANHMLGMGGVMQRQSPSSGKTPQASGDGSPMVGMSREASSGGMQRQASGNSGGGSGGGGGNGGSSGGGGGGGGDKLWPPDVPNPWWGDEHYDRRVIHRM